MNQHNMRELSDIKTTEREKRRRVITQRIVYLTLATVISLSTIGGGVGCEESNTTTEVEVYGDQRAMFLMDVKDRILRPLLQEAQEDAVDLVSAIETRDLSEARLAWREMTLSWQRLEVLQFGPAGGSSLRLGGEDLRDQIYAFPLHNPCRVDQELVRGEFGTDGWVDDAPINVIGIDAMERLLIENHIESACPASAQLIREGQWSSFNDDASSAEEQRWAYLSVLAAGLRSKLLNLGSKWDGSFGQAFVEASAPFSSQRDVIDQVFAGIYYVDEMVKDLKLGAPAGIYMTCLQDICPEQLELRADGLSALAIVQNLETTLAVFRGELLDFDGGSIESLSTEAREPVGLSDLLITEGAEELANSIESGLEEALIELRELESLEISLTEDLERVTEIHRSIKAVSDLMKSQMVTVLNLSVPQEGAGDND